MLNYLVYLERRGSTAVDSTAVEVEAESPELAAEQADPAGAWESVHVIEADENGVIVWSPADQEG